MFSLIFLTHTALLLGQGQLASHGIDTDSERQRCQNELFRSARLVQEALTAGPALTRDAGAELEGRIGEACYGNPDERTARGL